jgi:hypothetical protein
MGENGGERTRGRYKEKEGKIVVESKGRREGEKTKKVCSINFSVAAAMC